METLLSALKPIAILVAAILVGNWFLGEVKKAKALQKPWYAPYLSLPGILILLALLSPLVIWLLK